MVTKVRERVPIQVLDCQPGEPGAEPRCTLTGRRFMGTLLHPVPRSEMLRQFGVDRRGYRITVDWPHDGNEEHPVKAGDRLALDDQTYEVCGVKERPGCYLDLFMEER